jgi:hypothetical protein
VAVLEFLTAAAGTGIVSSGLRVCFLQFLFLCLQQKHNFGRRSISTQQIRHQSHRTIYVVEKRLVAVTQIVQTRLAVRRLNKPVLWTTTVAHESHITFAAETRKAI